MLGATQQCTLFLTRHENVLTEVNSCRAEYLFSSRKLGAKYDLGDKTFTCGRRGDAFYTPFKIFSCEFKFLE